MKYRSVAWFVATTALTMLGGPTSCNDNKVERGSTSSGAHGSQASAADGAKGKETQKVEELSAADQKAFDELANKANELDKKLAELAQGDPSEAAIRKERNAACDAIAAMGDKVVPAIVKRYFASSDDREKQLFIARASRFESDPRVVPVALDALKSERELTLAFACGILARQEVKSAGDAIFLAVLKAKKRGDDTTDCDEALKKLGYVAKEQE